MDLVELFMAISLAVSFILLYSRKKKWNKNRLRWGVTGVLFLIGITSVLIDYGRLPDHGFYFLFSPLVYNCFDRWFKHISERKHGRDFYLYLRHSEEIDDGISASNPHLKSSDKIFSLLLLAIIIGLMVLGAVISYDLNH